MLKFALSGTNPKFYEKFALPEVCRFIRSIGLDAIELVDANIEPIADARREVGVWSNLDIEKARRTLVDERVKAPVLQFRFAFNTDRGGEVDTHVAEFKSCIDAAAVLGAGRVLHYLCYSAFDRLGMDLVHRYCDEPLRYAREKGIVLVMENEFENPANQLPEKMLAIMEEFDDPFFLTNYDAPNYQMAGAEGYPYAYNLLKTYIGYAHLKNVCVFDPRFFDPRYEIGHTITGGIYAGKPIAFVPAFDGVVNIPAVLDRLIADGYDGYVTFEPHAELGLAMEDIQRDMAKLRRLGYA